ncbi:hypothetical protein NGM10_07305 [Halorussus salilacus]|uniref:hypothetical protein n=1 Tax=Halorussus salilacus TaxID=2953750 RepID=UPI0020A221CA|nr:hypothetical protein [Halorussus salilacus]USZ69531.1 hypothetical protein NGM10_07305 [Halorussus salilacus]
MLEGLFELASQTLAVAVYAVGTLALSGIGLLAEYNGVQQFLGGETMLAGWFAFMGVVALGFAANLGREKLVPLRES